MLIRKGRWRSLLGLKGQLWYYSDAALRKTADRPHRLTIGLGLLSPLLAIAAVGVSYLGLRTSENAMKTGQRAYLAFALESVTTSQNLQSDSIAVSLGLKIKNPGNTPAFIDSGSRSVKVFWKIPPEVTLEPYSIVERLSIVNPKDEVVVPDLLPLPKNDRSCLVNEDVPYRHVPGECKLLELDAYIFWHDVFGESHEERTCWLFNERDGQAETRRCPNGVMQRLVEQVREKLEEQRRPTR
jgi:hypothetical protein